MRISDWSSDVCSSDLSPVSATPRIWRVKDMAQTEDFKAKTDDQLAEQLGELKREAFNLRFQAATGQLEQASRVKEVRRSIARIKTQHTARYRSAAKQGYDQIPNTS